MSLHFIQLTVTLDHVDACPSLNWLIASDNNLQADDGLENQRHLWYLDLGNNQVGWGIHSYLSY